LRRGRGELIDYDEYRSRKDSKVHIVVTAEILHKNSGDVRTFIMPRLFSKELHTPEWVRPQSLIELSEESTEYFPKI
jgi:hypothetical protein